MGHNISQAQEESMIQNNKGSYVNAHTFPHRKLLKNPNFVLSLTPKHSADAESQGGGEEEQQQ